MSLRAVALFGWYKRHWIGYSDTYVIITEKNKNKEMFNTCLP